MTCRIGKNKITCTRGDRGANLARMKSIVKDTKGAHWLCEYTKDQFNTLNDMYSVDVYNEKGQLEKKFIKSYLTHINDVPKD